jgi:hypothetical protein
MDMRGLLSGVVVVGGIVLATTLPGCGGMLEGTSRAAIIIGKRIKLPDGREVGFIKPYNFYHQHYWMFPNNPSDEIYVRNFKSDIVGKELDILIKEYKRDLSGEKHLERTLELHRYPGEEGYDQDVRIDGIKQEYNSMPDGLMEKVLLGKDYRKKLRR